MPQYFDFGLIPNTDLTLQVQMTPPVNISSWGIQLYMTTRFGGISGVIVSYLASGYSNNVSGMSIINSGQGIFSAFIPKLLMSGRDTGDYAYNFNRTDSGSAAVLVEGFCLYSY